MGRKGVDYGKRRRGDERRQRNIGGKGNKR